MEEMNYAQMWQRAREEAKLEIEYARLSLTEKLSVLLSGAAIVIAMTLIVVAVLFFVGCALLLWLMGVTGSVWIATLIVIGVLLLLTLLLYGYRKPLIINPVTRFVTKLLLSPHAHQ